MDTLTSVAQQLYRRYLIFAPLVNRVRTKHRIQHHRYELLMSRLAKVCNVALSVSVVIRDTGL